MTYKVPERIFRTADGRLVRHGDPGAAFLAYTKGQEVADEEAKRSGLLALEKAAQKPAEEPQEKAAEQPEDKLAARPVDKGVTRAPRAGKST